MEGLTSGKGNIGVALFGNAKKEAAENEVRRDLSDALILDQIMDTLKNPKNDKFLWCTHCQSFYDRRWREITVEEDLFQVRWVGVENMEFKARYTDAGYIPLHAHINEKDNEDVSLKKVLYLWCDVIKQRMENEFPDFEFRSVIQDGERSSFEYRVPNLTWMKWF